MKKYLVVMLGIVLFGGLFVVTPGNAFESVMRPGVVSYGETTHMVYPDEISQIETLSVIDLPESEWNKSLQNEYYRFLVTVSKFLTAYKLTAVSA